MVELPEEEKIMGSWWMFTVKHKPNGEVNRYKVRLVAKGYTHAQGTDHD